MITLTQNYHIDLSADANMELHAAVKQLFTFTITGTDHIEALLHKCTQAIDAADTYQLGVDYTNSITLYQNDMSAHDIKLSMYLKWKWLKRAMSIKPVEPKWDTYNQNIIASNTSIHSNKIIEQLQQIVQTLTGVDWVNGVFMFQQFHTPPFAHRLMCLLDPRDIWKEPK